MSPALPPSARPWWSHGGYAPQAVERPPLWRLVVTGSPVRPLHDEDPTRRGVLLRGVARVHLDWDEWGGHVHRLVWDARSDGCLFEAEDMPGPSPEVRDVLDHLDGGPLAAAVGDPVAVLAAEVRRLRGMRPAR